MKKSDLLTMITILRDQQDRWATALSNKTAELEKRLDALTASTLEVPTGETKSAMICRLAAEHGISLADIKSDEPVSQPHKDYDTAPEQGLRRVEMQINAVDMTAIANITGNEKLYQLIGYLCAWNMSFPYTAIYCDVLGNSQDEHDIEIVAQYRRTRDAAPGYTIAAVWDKNEQRFTFHS
jgi:hypothetical protein